MSIAFGVDRLIERPDLLGKIRQVGLLTNDAARPAGNANEFARSALLDAGVPIARLFSPEHGLTAAEADGVGVSDGVDHVTGLPVTSLYGTHMVPLPVFLADLDALLFDVPDVGARFYTYIWTLSHAIDACAAAGIPVVVLDRPNPLGGRLEDVEGPLADPNHFSFVGRHAIPIRHSLTLGEFAMLWRAERRPDAVVKIVTCMGWSREQLWPDTGLPFVPTSPGITTFDAALFYPGLCLFEATNLSVGRGSDYSFRTVGAPWLDVERVIDRFSERSLADLNVTPVQFTPAVGPHADSLCNGVELRATDAGKLRPVAVGLALLADIIALHPREFAWATYPTAANPTGAGHFERIFGQSGVSEFIEKRPNEVTRDKIRTWTEAPGWKERWQQIQRYESIGHPINH